MLSCQQTVSEAARMFIFIKFEGVQMSVTNEKRLHRRISGYVAKNATILFSDFETSPTALVNISYGGFATKLSSAQLEKIKDQDKISIELQILGQSIKTEAKLVNQVGEIYGFTIMHSGIEALMFLRGVFEHWSNGTTCRLVNSGSAAKDSGGNAKIFVNGEGPTDAIIEKTNSSPEMNLTLTYLTDGDYAQVEIRDGVSRTGKSYGDSKMPGASVRMDSAIDQAVLRQAVCILSGISLPEIQQNIDWLIEIWIDLL
jgi:hypothetical protein